jgi:hypothetical protein
MLKGKIYKNNFIPAAQLISLLRFPYLDASTNSSFVTPGTSTQL